MEDTLTGYPHPVRVSPGIGVKILLPETYNIRASYKLSLYSSMMLQFQSLKPLCYE